VTSIGNLAFQYCTSLTKLTIPGSVTSFGVQVFLGCTSLTGVTIENGVTNIAADIFYGCSSLTNITIPSSVTSIGSQAFYLCTNLANITIPNSVTSIGYEAFYVTGLINLTIPNSVTSIGDYAFYYCSSLTRVYFEGNVPSADSTVFYGDKATVYYLPGTVGWGAMFGGVPTSLWKPQIQTNYGSFGMQSNSFGFNITWASNVVVEVEACTNLANPSWSPVATNTLTNGSFYFNDPAWTNYPTRFYRLFSP